MKRYITLGLVTLLSGTAACLAQPPNDSELAADLQSEPLIGGFDGSSDALDAVGSISVISFDRETGRGTLVQNVCTGALLDEDTVLTARHCITDLGAIVEQGLMPVFSLGQEADAPRDWREVIAVEGAPGDVGGVAQEGHDVAVLHLVRPFEAPRVVAVDGLGDTPLGTAFSAIGYGFADNARTKGTRRIGQVHLNAMSGLAYEVLFGSFEAFYEYAAGLALPDACANPRPEPPNPDEPMPDPALDPCGYASVLRYQYETVKLEDHDDVVVARTPGDAQPCYGDSGGPLVRADSTGALVAYGVASTRARFSLDQICTGGGVYATFDEDVLEFLHQAVQWTDPCAGLPVGGMCDGPLTRRCTRMVEGPRRVVALDCRTLGLSCAMDAAGEASCESPSEQTPQ